MTDIIIIDTETTGLDLIRDDIWEFAAIRRRPNGEEFKLHLFIDHNYDKIKTLPEDFQDAYRERYDENESVNRHEAAIALSRFLSGGRPHLVGMNPAFDAYRLELFMKNQLDWGYQPGWHYHLIDLENVMIGYARALHLKGSERPFPWKSDELSRMIGVDPDQFGRHTAVGDVEWAKAVYDKIFN
jgi:DNA polymerase III epsilon subunit-like protein